MLWHIFQVIICFSGKFALLPGLLDCSMLFTTFVTGFHWVQDRNSHIYIKPAHIWFFDDVYHSDDVSKLYFLYLIFILSSYDNGKAMVLPYKVFIVLTSLVCLCHFIFSP